MDLSPIFLSFKLAFITTVILLFLGILLALWIETLDKLKPIVNSIIALPIVLPPSVLGFYFLVAFSSDYLKEFNLLFSFKGLVVASVIYSLPFMVQPIQTALNTLNKNMIFASYLSGKGKIETFFKIVLPNIKKSILIASVMTFAHTVGEFGVILMIGGSIDNETKVASIAIYEYVENLDYQKANFYSVILLLVSFFTILGLNYLTYDRNKNR